MNFSALDTSRIPVNVCVSHFEGAGGVSEFNLMIVPTTYGSFDDQMAWLRSAYKRTLQSLELNGQTAVFRRFFCSDLVNQATLLKNHAFSNPLAPDEPCAVSWVGQPPTNEAKVALWAYHISDPSAPLLKHQYGSTLSVERGPLAHIWTTGIVSQLACTSADQTRRVFEMYDHFLRERGMTLRDNLLRTWLFVQNIDANYKGLVGARREFFHANGLTAGTHYVASSGIEGAGAQPDIKVTLDAYAIAGIRREQIEYPAALDHLGPTHLYGVTFERATSIAYRDRKHVIISGTASIDPQGNILYPGDVLRQLDRALENIEALLRQGGATLNDMASFIVYVRDAADHEAARRAMRERFGNVLLIVVVAAVCRPGWLIEVEGIAVVPADNPALPTY